ncbi:hypothetical protein F4680DRAFT_469834 [Xylaria scruposa]|nr:hypothetical protein F4680DRAFT_469834 [Xylaria scruposa]
MANSDGIKVEQPEVRPLGERIKQFLLRIRNQIPLFWPQQYLQDPPFFASRHVVHQGPSYRQDEDESSVDDPLGRLPDVKLSSELYSKMEIGSWNLLKQITPIKREGVVTQKPRVIVDPRLVHLGKKFSGIFKIISIFEGPGGFWRNEGTAFAVGRFHVLTAGHVMWHPKLGPAQSAVLYPDIRSGTNYQRIECVAAAVHAKWMKFHQSENDFCMVALARGLCSGIHHLQLGAAPPHSDEGRVIGFPLDLPVTSQGSELIECRGPVQAHQYNTGVILIHKVNTSGGNSGSPLFVGEEVVAVHSSFNRNTMENYAVPISQNGNDVTQFQSVLRHTMDPHLEPSDETPYYLGEVTHDKYRKQKVLAFGSLAASGR